MRWKLFLKKVFLGFFWHSKCVVLQFDFKKVSSTYKLSFRKLGKVSELYKKWLKFFLSLINTLVENYRTRICLTNILQSIFKTVLCSRIKVLMHKGYVETTRISLSFSRVFLSTPWKSGKLKKRLLSQTYIRKGETLTEVEWTHTITLTYRHSMLKSVRYLADRYYGRKIVSQSKLIVQR